ncbi:MAG: polyprenyl synthetase family protein [Melioribacteraceae bacterium]|nr:polyprenyl synthetase family protein [Melioribacteraceae bacterium]
MKVENLNKINDSVKDELSEFNKKFRESLKSNISIVDLVTKYILKQKGKKVRPLLVLLAANLSGGITERSYRGATLVELLHTATLVHDDVVDSADKRRGLPSINSIWKNKISVLMGDYLLSRGLMISVDGEDFDFLKVMTLTVKRMSEGELLQISKTRKLDIDEETYFRIVSDKTASLLSTCCEIGALSASDNEEYHKALKDYGENLGIAFQIRDDILDLIGTALFGKSIGGDIKEKKLTLPLISALKNVSKDEADKILKLIKKADKKDNLNKIIEFIKENGGIEYATEKAKEYASKAKDSLNVFDDSESKQALQDLVDFVLDRKK